MEQFKKVTKEELEESKKWAQDNYEVEEERGRLNYPGYHPVVRLELAKIRLARLLEEAKLLEKEALKYIEEEVTK